MLVFVHFFESVPCDKTVFRNIWHSARLTYFTKESYIKLISPN